MLRPEASQCGQQVRQLQVSDAPGVLGVWQQANNTDYGITVLKQELGQQVNCQHYGAFNVEGKVQGLITLGWIGCYGKAIGLYVAPDCRRQGIASSLLKHLLKSAQSLQLKQINLEVVDTNLAAIDLYCRFGFRSDGVENSSIGASNRQKNLFLSISNR